MPYKGADDAPFSTVYIPIQHPLMNEFRHGVQVKFTANDHTQAFSLSLAAPELAFTELDYCVAKIKAERLARLPLQKRAPGALPQPAIPDASDWILRVNV